MAEFFGAIQGALGAALDGIYSVTGVYALAIVVLTVAVRALLIPLTVKQIRSMTAMQRLAPEQKKIQAKYKQLQQKAKDRAEVQQIRLKMNEEMQGLFKQHGVNPLGGCLPLVAQMPVFIAMFTIMRASIIVVPFEVAPVGNAPALPEGNEARSVICLPVDPATGDTLEPRPGNPTPTRIECLREKGEVLGSYEVGGFREGGEGTNPELTNAGWISSCRATGNPESPLVCHSSTGTGHLPRDGELFKDVTLERASVLGMHSGCNANQVGSLDKLRECAPREDSAGTGQAIPYYLLVLLIVGSSYYQSKQMAARATGIQAQQQKMMTRVMPILFGFISLSIPAGANMYFLTTNAWQIGQQHILLKRQQAEVPVEPSPEKPKKEALPEPAEQPAGPRKPHPASKKKRKRKR